MTNGDDLFPGDNRGSINVKPAKTASQFRAEDDVVLAEIKELAGADASPLDLSLAKRVMAMGLTHKKASALATVAGIAAMAAIVGTSFYYHGEPRQPAEVATLELPEAITAAPISRSQEPAESHATAEADSDPKISLEGPEVLSLPPSPKGADEVVNAMQENNVASPDQELVVPKEIVVKAVPVRTTTIRVVDEPFAGKIPDSADVSASSVIDQMGFGSKQPEAPASSETTSDSETVSPPTATAGQETAASTADETPPGPAIEPPTIIAPVPAAKPTTPEVSEVPAVRYRIVERKGEKSGFWRRQGDDVTTTEWFVVVEAVDANGKTFTVPVKSADTGVIKEVSKWAIQVSEKDFLAFSDELLKKKAISNPVIGKATSKTSQPQWSVSTTGSMLTEW